MYFSDGQIKFSIGISHRPKVESSINFLRQEIDEETRKFVYRLSTT